MSVLMHGAPQMTLAMHLAETLAHLTHAGGGDSSESEKGFEIHCRPVPVCTGGAFHRRCGFRSVGGEFFAAQRHTQCGTHPQCHSVVVQEHECVPGIEENRAKRLSRVKCRNQRKRRSAPRPSIASRASGSYTTLTSTLWRKASSMAASTISITGIGSPSPLHSASVRARRPESPHRKPGSPASELTSSERTCPRASAFNVAFRPLAPQPVPMPSSISCTCSRSAARSYASRTAKVVAWTEGGDASFGFSRTVPISRSVRYECRKGSTAPASAPGPASTIGVEALSAGAFRAKPGQLPAVIGCHFEETRPAPVEHDGKKATELLFDRCELAHQGRDVDRQPRAMHHRQRNHLEQIDSLTGEDGEALRMRKIGGCSEELLHPVQIPRKLIRDPPIEPQPGERP